MNKEKTLQYIDSKWEDWFVTGLSDFVRVPNQTPMVDPDYLTNGLVQKAIELVDSYIQKLNIRGLSKKIFHSEVGIPLVVYIVDADEGINKNIMVYGHLDKQPYGAGWLTDPCDPVIKGNILYGRGASDDGYAPFSCMLGVKAAQEQGVKLPRICLVLETEEESGSDSLIPLLKLAKETIGTPDAMYCMDSGAFDYESLWITSSLRGICCLEMNVQVGQNAYHSGEVGGIVPETFRIVRQLLDRLDDPVSGKVMEELQAEVPEWKLAEAENMVKIAGNTIYNKYNVVEGAQYCSQHDLKEMYLDNQWRANLSVTGADGLPPIAIAGNAVRANTGVKLSMRLPPTMDPQVAEEAIIKKLTTNVPYNAKVSLKGAHAGSGWCMKEPAAWLDAAIKTAALDFFDNKPVGSYGMGGSIPFLSELEKMYPNTQIIAFGLLGPNSNAHGPNEMIDLNYAKKLTCALAHVMAASAQM